MKTIDREIILDALTNVGGHEDDISEGYSGRGMNGRECLAIATEASMFHFYTELNLLDEDGELGTTLEDNERSDSLGRMTIYYWPAFTLDESDDD